MRNAHLQTILSSTARKLWVPQSTKMFQQSARQQVIEVDDVRLLVHLNLHDNAPLVMLIPGWLGSYRSSYVVATGQALWQAGFSVARINLRDHGDTAYLNEEMFNSAMIDEVVHLITNLHRSHGAAGCGLMGFSLGGNFALRAARALPGLTTLAVCPAMEPADTMVRIDCSAIYQRYFINKWRKVWAAKQRAFPNRYDFGAALQLNTVSALTDYFVHYHSPFASTREYFDAYDLSGASLSGVNAHILAARDDPIIAAAHFEQLPESLEVHLTRHGGHGAYLESWSLRSWLDDYAIAFFAEHLRD